MFRILLFTTLILFLTVPTAHGQIVRDGDLDGLPVGFSPGCNQPAGAWFWPLNYLAFFCETSAGQFTIVPTNSFDPGATGNSLHHHVNLEAGQPNTEIHLPNVFNEPIQEASNPQVIVTFDIWVPEAGVSGGNVYVGGDHGGGGFDLFTDRGPHMGWQTDGTFTVSALDPFTGCPTILLDPYPVGVWQTVRLEIDLLADNYDVWWAVRGDPLALLGSDLEFLNGALLDHLDRFTVVRFTGPHPCFPTGSTHSYLDNLVVSVCPPDINGDGTVDVLDLIELLLAFGGTDPAADTNNDGVVNVLDLIELLLAFGTTCP